jgi:excisionase family DNA binding protein
MRYMERELEMANIVTAKEVSEYLKLTESTIYKLASVGEIPGFKIGKSWRFDMQEILRRIKSMKNNSKVLRETNGRNRQKMNGFG